MASHSAVQTATAKSPPPPTVTLTVPDGNSHHDIHRLTAADGNNNRFNESSETWKAKSVAGVAMDDWYLELCKRNAKHYVPVDAPSPDQPRRRSGSFHGIVKFVAGSNDDLTKYDNGTGHLQVTPAANSPRSTPKHRAKVSSKSASKLPPKNASFLVVPETEYSKMKKVMTDPRILTGKKHAMSLTQWYDDELNDIDLSSSALDQSHGSGNLHDMSEASSTASGSPWSSGPVPANSSQMEHERDHLASKINKMNDQLQLEQKSQQLNVNEYLALSQSIPAKDRAQAQRVKASFERRNQKSTATMLQLQRKLDAYKGRLELLDKSLANAAEGGAGGAAGSPWQGGVLRGIRTTIAKPKAFAFMLRKQFGSADNITAIQAIEEHVTPEDQACTLPASFRCHSDEELSKLSSPSSTIAAAMSLASPTAMIVSPPSSEATVRKKDHAGPDSGSGIATSQSFVFPPVRRSDDRWPSTADTASERRDSIASSYESLAAAVVESVKKSREAFAQKQREFEQLKKQLVADQAQWRELLESQRERSEQLVDRLNDMTDLQQCELLSIKQELSMFEEKLAYQLDERVRDMQEMVDSCHNRLARLEAVQRSSVEGVGGAVGDGRTPVIKLINVALSILALLLVVVGLVINLFGPFVSTRRRAIVTAAVIAVVAIFWYFSDSIFGIFHPVPGTLHDKASTATQNLTHDFQYMTSMDR